MLYNSYKKNEGHLFIFKLVENCKITIYSTYFISNMRNYCTFHTCIFQYQNQGSQVVQIPAAFSYTMHTHKDPVTFSPSIELLNMQILSSLCQSYNPKTKRLYLNLILIADVTHHSDLFIFSTRQYPGIISIEKFSKGDSVKLIFAPVNALFSNGRNERLNQTRVTEISCGINEETGMQNNETIVCESI